VDPIVNPIVDPIVDPIAATAVVTDRRMAFMGSANTTTKSLRNGELCFRLRGPPVLDVLQFLQQERDGGEELV